jgi:chromosome segregation ATPase
VADEIEKQVWGFLGSLRSSDDVKQRIRDHALRIAESVDNQAVRVAEQEVKRLECSLERAKELYIEGSVSKSEFVRQTELLKRRLAEAKARLGRISPDLRKLELQLERMDRIIDVVREGAPSEQREAIDALIDHAREKQAEIVEVVFREWARGLLSD